MEISLKKNSLSKVKKLNIRYWNNSGKLMICFKFNG